MASTVRGFSYRDITYHGKGEVGRRVVSVGKALPSSGVTGDLFTVTGSVVVTGLFGIISTILQAVAVKPTLGVTGSPAAIAAAPAVAFNATAVGSVINMPLTAGGALPAPITVSGAAAAANQFVVSANITITPDATVTGAITWVLSYVPLMPKGGAGAVAA